MSRYKGVVRSAFCSIFAVTLLCAGVTLAAAIPININIYGNPTATPDAPSIVAIQKFKEILENRVGDKVKVTIYWDLKLGSSFEAAVNGVQNGLIQMTELTASNFSDFSKACIPVTAPFVFIYPYVEVAHRAIDGKAGDMMRKRVIEESGLRIAAFWETGFRHVTSVEKPIPDLAALQGMKIRVQPNPIHIAAFKALGTNPTPIAWGELFTALQQNVVDGAENPLQNLIQARLYEVQKHMTLSGHTFEFVLYVVNEEWYQELPEDVRNAWDESLQEALIIFRESQERKVADYLDFLKTKMNVTELSAEEMAKFREAIKPSYEEVVKQVGKEYFDEIMAEIAKVEQEHLESLHRK